MRIQDSGMVMSRWTQRRSCFEPMPRQLRREALPLCCAHLCGKKCTLESLCLRVLTLLPLASQLLSST